MGLTEREKNICKKHGMDETFISKVKSGWEDAHDVILSSLKNPDGLENAVVKYRPVHWDLPHYRDTLEVDEQMVVKFMTPNQEFEKDVWPTLEGKIGSLSHELLGHVADDRENYVGKYSESLHEYNNYMASEQRANLRAFHLFPKETMSHVGGILEYLADLYIGGKDSLIDFDDLMGLETLGRIGMHRSFNVIDFLDDLKSSAKEPLYNMFKNGRIFTYAGLVTPPWINDSKHLGIKNNKEYDKFSDSVAKYLVDGTTRDHMKSLIDAYKVVFQNKQVFPEYSVTVETDGNEGIVIDKDIAIQNHIDFRDHLQNDYPNAKHDWVPDLIEASQKIENKLKNA